MVMLLKEAGTLTSSMDDPCPLPVTSKEKLQCPLQFITRMFERDARTVCAEGSGWSMAVKSRGVQVPGSTSMCQAELLGLPVTGFFCLCSLSLLNLFLGS